MKIVVKRQSHPFQLEATNEDGNAFSMDASPKIGGSGKGFRPMETLIAGLGGCSSIDVLMIMDKSKQPLRDIEVTIEAERQKDVEPSLFETIHAHFKLYGDVEESKARRAVELSMLKYCSVARTLEKSAKITFSWEVLP